MLNRIKILVKIFCKLQPVNFLLTNLSYSNFMLSWVVSQFEINDFIA